MEMGVQVESSQIIDRPIDKVFRFMVDDHVRNHPRWDSDIELWLESDEPIRLGTIIHRRNSRSGTPVEGTMEVVEFKRNKSFATLIHDGPMKMMGEIHFEPLGKEQTKVLLILGLPDMDESTDTSFLERRLQETAAIRKQLIEAET
ncbi:MAG: hypothetical protein PVF85_07995 [Anaerolineales bacterium]|jgi:uncharacterized membrane protein